MQESHISLSITPKEAARVYYAILKDEEYYYDNQYCKKCKNGIGALKSGERNFIYCRTIHLFYIDRGHLWSDTFINIIQSIGEIFMAMDFYVYQIK